MLDNDKLLVNVTNISGAPVVYRVPELNNVRREFQKAESKKITVGELRALQYRPGGKKLLKDYLSVDNDELLMEFGIKPEVEYKWTAKDVKDMLLNGSLERLQDALDYAPAGIVEIIKDLAVSLEINDMSKRHAIQQTTHFNVTKAIEINQESKIIDEEEVPTKTSQRRVVEEVVTVPTRRVEVTPVTPNTIKTNYKVVKN